MRKVFCILTLAGWTLAVGLITGSNAGVVIKVRALNPLETEETAKIYYSLPAEIKETDILEQKVTFSLEHTEEEEPRKTQLNISVDDTTGGLYVDDEVLLFPKEVMTLAIDVRDVWVIAPEQIDGLRQEAARLLEDWERRKEVVLAEEAEQPEEEVEQPETEDEKVIALTLKDEILNQLDQIVHRQENYTIIKAGVERHISGYKENIEALRQVRQDMEMLANLLRLGGEEDEADQSGEEGTDAPEALDVKETQATEEGQVAPEVPNAEEGQGTPMSSDLKEPRDKIQKPNNTQ